MALYEEDPETDYDLLAGSVSAPHDGFEMLLYTFFTDADIATNQMDEIQTELEEGTR